MKVARQLHDQLAAAGIDVLLDDRDCRAGVKFKDADLIGVPLRVVIGERGLKEGKLEVKWRWDKEVEKIDLDGAAATLAEVDLRGTPGGEAVSEPIDYRYRSPLRLIPKQSWPKPVDTFRHAIFRRL